MYPFSQSVSPAVRTHIDAQTAFLNDMSKSMFRSFQQMWDLNIQLMQTLLEESTLASQQLLTADRAPEMLSAAASRAQPTTEKLRAYQQHISRLAADTQVDMARVTAQHAQNTGRTARALADEVARNASEETERGIRTQQENIQRYADPFSRAGEGAAQPQQSQAWADRASATMQSGAQQDMSHAGSQAGSGMQHSAGSGEGPTSTVSGGHAASSQSVSGGPNQGMQGSPGASAAASIAGSMPHSGGASVGNR